MFGLDRKRYFGVIGIYVRRESFVIRKVRKLEVTVANVKRNSRILIETWSR